MRVYWSPLDNQVVLGRNHGTFCKGFIFCGSPLTVKVDAKIEGDETCNGCQIAHGPDCSIFEPLWFLKVSYLISKCPFGVFKPSKKTTKFFQNFCPSL